MGLHEDPLDEFGHTLVTHGRQVQVVQHILPYQSLRVLRGGSRLGRWCAILGRWCAI